MDKKIKEHAQKFLVVFFVAIAVVSVLTIREEYRSWKAEQKLNKVSLGNQDCADFDTNERACGHLNK